MNSFLSGLTFNDVLGENSMPAHSTSDSFVLDLFFLLGTRPKALGVLPRAWGEDQQLTARVLFQSRDVRGGKGERDSFRRAIRYIGQEFPEQMAKLVPHIPEYGRWDDLHALIGTKSEDVAIGYICLALGSYERSQGSTHPESWAPALADAALCAKWQPRKGPIAEKIRAKLGLTPKQYRKLLVALTKVVETKMCAKQWGEINYSQVPSQASRIYAKAFHRHDQARYDAWREELKKPKEDRDPKVKVNTGALYPHEIVAQAVQDSVYPFEQAWADMQEKFPPIEEKILVVCDTSDSMTWAHNPRPIDVCVSLGLFFSQRNTGPFQDCFITFSSRPRLQRLNGNLRQRIHQLQRAEWEGNTDLEAVLRLVLHASGRAADADLPSIILIISDMQFDQCVVDARNNAMEMIDREYRLAGFKRPKVVFWNVREAGGNAIPVKQHQSGAAIVSGFSPNLVKTFMTNPKDFTPYGIMLNAVNTPRYERIKL